MSENQIVINNLSKVYDNGFNALKNINLNIKKGEIFAMLGPNGAGKTTLISIICGIVKPSSGKVTVEDFDIIEDYRETRSRIGLVPQELTLEQFETVFNNVSYSRGLYGKKPDPTQPTAGVDVELRQEMWKVVKSLREIGVTIILTTHYIEEAEEIADRVGVINQGEIIIVEQKKELIKKMGHKVLSVELQEEVKDIPDSLKKYNLIIGSNKMSLAYTYNLKEKQTGITNLLQDIKDSGLKLKDLKTEQSNLEKIFVL